MKIIATLAVVLLTPTLAIGWDFKQTQYQGQSQGQIQTQGQANDQTIAPSQSVHFDQVRQAPVVVAPSLTSGGIGICLGSFSIGASAWGAGAAFGKTVVDDGCERARDSMILWNMGHKGAALRVLSGQSISDAMAEEGILPARRNAAAPVVPEPTPTVSSTNFGTR